MAAAPNWHGEACEAWSVGKASPKKPRQPRSTELSAPEGHAGALPAQLRPAPGSGKIMTAQKMGRRRNMRNGCRRNMPIGESFSCPSLAYIVLCSSLFSFLKYHPACGNLTSIASHHLRRQQVPPLLSPPWTLWHALPRLQQTAKAPQRRPAQSLT